jgi:tetratricopeptide (TPR) repeat protein
MRNKCGHCKTRYCGRDCQKLHWKGGHRAICQEIKRGGGAEPYHANKKCTEAVAVAVEKCAEDTKGQRCYICLENGSEEGLVRGCACRGGSGFAHISCLAKQAKILYAQAENNLDDHAMDAKWNRWSTCGLCEQKYHGVVACALGWACWKTYVGRPETDWARSSAMMRLGNSLTDARHHEDAASVYEARLSLMRRVGAREENMAIVKSNLAGTYQRLGRLDEASKLLRDVYSEHLRLWGEEHRHTLREANNYASCLCDQGRFEEAKALLRETVPRARRVLGEENHLTLVMRWNYARALYEDDGATLEDLREAVNTLDEIERTARRVLGAAHPHVQQIERSLQNARRMLRARESPDA